MFLAYPYTSETTLDQVHGGLNDSFHNRAADGFLGAQSASAQTPVRVMTGYAATSGPHAVLWMAREAGLFDKNGIRAEVAYIRSGSTMAQTLVSGEIQMSQMGGPALLAAGVAGMDVTFVAVALNTTPIVIMGTVSRMEELKGKGVGVTRYGSNTDIDSAEKPVKLICHYR